MRTANNIILKILAIVFFLVILSINSKTITSSLRAAFMDPATAPLRSWRVVSSAVKKLIPFASFREENARLRDKVSLLSRKLEEAKMAQDENERLKALMDFRRSVPYTTIPAEVIGRDPTNWSNSLIINKGLGHGVRQDRAALSVKGLVGRVVEVGRHSGKILLITDPNSKVGVLVQRNRQGGILVGRPDGRCKMVYIALDSDVARGDKVITAGFGGVFPKDVLVGEVVQVFKEPGRLYKYAVIKTAADLSKLEEVLCIK